MSREKKKKKKIEIEENTLNYWTAFFEEKFNDIQVDRMLLSYTWYLGSDDLLSQAYVEAAKTNFNNSIAENRNSKTYFWAIASMEADVKKTHSGIPKAIIKTLVNILGIPSIKVMKEVVDEGKVDLEENHIETERLLKILESNDFDNLVVQEQEPMMLSMGDGAFIPSIDSSISDDVIIEYIDGRNVAYERKGNNVSKLWTRQYFNDIRSNYCLLTEFGTTLIKSEDEDKKEERCAYIKYRLFEVSGTTRRICKIVPLNTIEETKDLDETGIYIKGIDSIIAIPCIHDFEKIRGRGTSLFDEKMGLFDDLDQELSQAANAVRVSTPIEEIDESMLESDENGKTKMPQTYFRKFLKIKGNGMNSVNNTPGIVSNVPQIDFAKYTDKALATLSTILTGIISPCTIGADVSKKDNADAQREKEKQTYFTRNNLIKLQTNIFKNLFSMVLKIDDIKNGNVPGNYEIVIDYEEYGNPTFDAKLQSLYPAFASGAMSPERYVQELYGDSLTDDEKEKEIEYLLSQKNVGIQLDDPMAYVDD